MPHYGAIPTSRSTSFSAGSDIAIIHEPQTNDPHLFPCSCGVNHDIPASSESFQCNICGKRFCTAEAGLLHFEDHGVYCDLCDRTFEDTKALEEHCQEKHFSCVPECDFICNSERVFRQHIESTHFRCRICDEFFFLRTDLSQHTFEKHTPTFGCDICTVSFPSKASLRQHAEHVHYQCPSCVKFFRTQSLLEEHQKEDHKSVDYPCAQCNKVFHSKDSWYWHSCQRKRRGSEAVQHKCEECHELFNSEKELDEHEEIAHPGNDNRTEYNLARRMFEHSRTKSLPMRPRSFHEGEFIGIPLMPGVSPSSSRPPSSHSSRDPTSPLRGGARRTYTSPQQASPFHAAQSFTRSRMTSISEDSDHSPFNFPRFQQPTYDDLFESTSSENSSSPQQSLLNYKGMPDVFFSTLALLASRKLRYPQLVQLPKEVHPLLKKIRDNAMFMDARSGDIEEVE